MSRISSNRINNRLHQLSVFVAAILIILTSCSIKGSIKSLADIPSNTEHGINKAHYSFSGNPSEVCWEQELTDNQILQTASFNTDDLFPVVLLTAIFLLPSSFTLRGDQPHPLYRTQKIAATLPLFLLYRKLLVYHSV